MSNLGEGVSDADIDFLIDLFNENFLYVADLSFALGRLRLTFGASSPNNDVDNIICLGDVRAPYSAFRNYSDFEVKNDIMNTIFVDLFSARIVVCHEHLKRIMIKTNFWDLLRTSEFQVYSWHIRDAESHCKIVQKDFVFKKGNISGSDINFKRGDILNNVHIHVDKFINYTICAQKFLFNNFSKDFYIKGFNVKISEVA